MHSKYISKFKALLVCLCLLCGWQLQADWSAPIDISPSEQTAWNPHVSVNNSGHAMAVWLEDLGAIYASYFDGTSWSSPALLDTDQYVWIPIVSLNDNDHAMAFWDKDGVGQVSYFDGTTWSLPTALSQFENFLEEPQIALNNNDRAIIVGSAYPSRVVEAVFFNGTEWSSVSQLSDGGLSIYGPDLSMNDSGHAFAVWTRYNGSIRIPQISFFDGSVWSEEAINLSNNETTTDIPKISLNDSGNAVAVWRESSSIRAAFYNGSEAEWSPPADLGQGELPQLSRLTSSNKAIAIWRESTGGEYILHSSVFNGNSWSMSAIFSGEHDFQDDYQIDLNDLDKAFAIWIASPSEGYIIRTSFFNGTDWSSSTDLTEDEHGQPYLPQIFLNNSGDAMAVWANQEHLGNGAHVIQAASFVPAPNPPQDLLGVKKANQFVFQTAFYNQLSWSASSSEEVTAYHIYRDDVLIGTVLADDVLVFTDRSIDWRLSYVYGVKAVNGEDVESSAVTVEIHP